MPFYVAHVAACEHDEKHKDADIYVGPVAACENHE